MKYKLENNPFYLSLIIPGLLVLLLITAIPTVMTIVYSFTNLHLIWPGSGFVGLKNYRDILSPGSEFYAALLLDILWTFFSVFFQLFFAVIGALALQTTSRRTTPIYRVMMIIPWTLPNISLAFLWNWMLEPSLGIINHFLLKTGLISEAVNWFGSARWSLASVTTMNIWFGIPFMMVTVIAGLQTISRNLYEAAEIDGASSWQCFWKITMPSLKRVILIAVTLRSIWVFNNFAFIYMTTGGGPGNRSQILPVLIYNTGWGEGWLGRSSAIAVLALILLMVGSVVALKLTKEDQ